MKASNTAPEAISPIQSDTIRTMFGQISGRYDLANTVLSMGIHHVWRKKLVRWSGARPGMKVLDCATGTGDLAFEFERALQSTGEVLGTDFSEPMLAEAAEKGRLSGSRARFEVVDVTKLPYGDASFDLASISFGIRNVNDPARGLSELGRVVRSGGAVMVLEFGQPRSALFGGLYRFYSMRVLPRLGGWITGKPEAYEYLQTSSAGFPCREAFLDLARGTGLFSTLEYKPVTGGIAYIYKLTRA
jgi:demethylmenaquinone methyltransferase / 2-methoxy-6-polyprenyl-1,4-benzoquinol methylase